MSHESAATATGTNCPSCLHLTSGAFCDRCGEAIIDEHSWSLGHFFHDLLHEFTHLDSKVFQTLWTLFRYPGKLTAEYWAGRRVQWIRPLRLFIVVAAIHLLAASASLFQYDFFGRRDTGGLLERQVRRIAAAAGRPVEEVKVLIGERMGRIYSIGQYFAVAAYALFPWMLYRRRRRWYVQHLIFSLHLYCFYFLVTSVTLRMMSMDALARYPLILVTAAYIYFSVRRLYQESVARSLWKALILRLGLMIAEAVPLTIALFGAVFWTAKTLGR